MFFFSKKPVFRLIFVLTYLLFSIHVLFDNFAWFNIPLAVLVLFGAHIALCKSKIVKKNFYMKIDDYSFDLFSSFVTIYVLIDVFFL